MFDKCMNDKCPDREHCQRWNEPGGDFAQVVRWVDRKIQCTRKEDCFLLDERLGDVVGKLGEMETQG